MGLLSKLFGKDVEKAAHELLDNLTGNQSAQTGQTEQPVSSYDNSAASSSDTQPAQEYGTSYWGDLMPAEENQYSYAGNYKDYFKYIFDTEFSDYDVSYSIPEGRYNEAVICKFTKNGETALAVELLSEKSCAQKFRSDCRDAGIPYLRFYYDHEGWWNVKSYVVGRIKGALKL